MPTLTFVRISWNFRLLEEALGESASIFQVNRNIVLMVKPDPSHLMKRISFCLPLLPAASWIRHQLWLPNHSLAEDWLHQDSSLTLSYHAWMFLPKAEQANLSGGISLRGKDGGGLRTLTDSKAGHTGARSRALGASNTNSSFDPDTGWKS